MRIIGIDLGGTNIKCVLFEKNKIVKEKVYKTPYKGIEIAQKIKSIILELCGNSPIDRVGIGLPGVIYKGKLAQAPNLPNLENFPLENFFKKNFHFPYYYDNDANCACLGEKVFGKAKNLRNFIFLTLGTGVGSGIFLNGKIYRGKTGGAGEIGHTTIFPDGILCNCGKRGCLEAYASKQGLKKILGENIEPKEVFKRAKNGEKKYLSAVLLFSKALGIAIGNIINIFAPEGVILGGGISKSFPFFKNDLIDTVKKNSFPSLFYSVRITVSELGTKSGVLGACALALRKGE